MHIAAVQRQRRPATRFQHGSVEADEGLGVHVIDERDPWVTECLAISGVELRREPQTPGASRWLVVEAERSSLVSAPAIAAAVFSGIVAGTTGRSSGGDR